MKDRYRLIRRRNRYYAVDRQTHTRESLETDNLRIARRLLVAKNEAAQQTSLNFLIGRTYLGANDPNMVLRTWQLVMDEFCQRGKEQTWVRRKRAMRTAALAGLKPKKLVETTADDLREAMALGGASVNHFLRCLHNLALGMGWIPVIPAHASLSSAFVLQLGLMLPSSAPSKGSTLCSCVPQRSFARTSCIPLEHRFHRFRATNLLWNPCAGFQ